MKRILNSKLIRLFSYMWKEGGNPFLGILYTVSMLAIASQSFMFNYIAAVGVKRFTDAIFQSNYRQFISGISFIFKYFIVVAILLTIFGYIYQYSIRKTTVIIRKNILKKILSLSLTNFEKRHSGEFISRLNNDVAVAEGVYSWQVMVLAMGFISLFGSSVVIFSINKILFLYSLFAGLLNLVFNSIFIRPLRAVSNRIQQKIADITSLFSDIVAGAFVIRSFNVGKVIYEKFVQANLMLLKLSLKRVHYNSILASFNYSFGYLVFLGQIVVGGLLIIDDKLTFGNLIACIQVSHLLIWFFGAIGQFLTSLQGSLAGAERIFEILDLNDIEYSPKELFNESEKSLKKCWNECITSNACVEFRNVSFSYNNSKDVLKDVSFKIKKGSKIAFVGESGGGKSTIFKLLLNLYEPNSGQILIFGKDIKEYTKSELRDLISYVSQDIYLFNETVFENIRVGRLDATEKEVIQAAQMAHAHEFIMNLPDKYDTIVGESGVMLSGGQRQRIAIARAILKNSPIILLDEATSFLDSESEKLVIDVLQNLMKDKTILMTAHRLSTAEFADFVYVIENGTVVESGTHNELIGKDGRYAYLFRKWSAQKI
ncbi:ABC transporter related protein [Caldicellulosiruptor owensensis OL]|uniref:ABC transporter related protein n=1 Tax=Caldicellulosiruptor owensensis (strain ATCC 700167 / DSM 13100 / OL) TaxID=632518 RepID=E4Q2M7_CALOW|nr:ABC transporter ATP-binding protein [Caldicellulosiruptor owensensis]ADQ03781.1 ABC transporter related protein [Caldicellulosiruptor owensensis OL]